MRLWGSSSCLFMYGLFPILTHLRLVVCWTFPLYSLCLNFFSIFNLFAFFKSFEYSHVLRNDVSVNNGLHMWQWSILLSWHSLFSSFFSSHIYWFSDRQKEQGSEGQAGMHGKPCSSAQPCCRNWASPRVRVSRPAPGTGEGTVSASSPFLPRWPGHYHIIWKLAGCQRSWPPWAHCCVYLGLHL